MKKVRKLFVLLCGMGVVYSITAASDSSNTITTQKSTVDTSNELNKIIETEEYNECFDTMMTEWFESFSILQDNGLSISEADYEASQVAVKYFANCD